MALEITAFDVLLWAAVVFIAGAIGYLGRHVVQTIIERLRGKKEPPSAEGDQGEPKTKEELDYDLEKKRLKLEKKSLKLEKKKAK